MGDNKGEVISSSDGDGENIWKGGGVAELSTRENQNYQYKEKKKSNMTGG